jgi:hypothetical protein
METDNVSLSSSPTHLQVTDLRLRAALHRIAVLADVEANMPPRLIEEAVVGSGGDLRHAIHLLQFAAIGCHHDADSASETACSNSSDDDFLGFGNQRNIKSKAGRRDNSSSSRNKSTNTHKTLTGGGRGRKNKAATTTNKKKVPRKFPKTKSAPAAGSDAVVKPRHLLGIGRDPMVSMTHAVGRVLRAKRTEPQQQIEQEKGSAAALVSPVLLPGAAAETKSGYDFVLPLTTVITSGDLAWCSLSPRPFAYHAALQSSRPSSTCSATAAPVTGAAKSCGAKGQLAFVPEQVVAECPLPPAAFASFVQHNVVEFFSDLADLGAAFDMLSVADVMHGMGAKLNCFGEFDLVIL